MSAELPGDGTTTVAIGTNDGHVVLKYPKPVQWAALDPATAAQVADAMLGAAIDLGARVEIKMPERKYTPQQIESMRARVALVMKNLQERGAKQHIIAAEIVDIILTMSK